MVTLRRLVAMLQLAVFGLPLLLSSLALGQGTDAGVPACCRRAGRHHCAMSMGERSVANDATQTPVWKSLAEQCPYCPACPSVSAHADLLLLEPVTVALGHEFGPAAIVRRAECSRRIARERARQKRGPPTPLFA